MNDFTVVFLALNAALLLLVPRHWAPLPLLLATCYTTVGQKIEIGPFSFTVLRTLVAMGAIRILIRKEWPMGGLCGLDWLMVLWAGWALCASGFHKDPMWSLIGNLGRAYDTLGLYFLIRCFCQTEEDVKGLVTMIVILLVPVSLAMLNEQLTHRNVFSVLGAVPETPQIRNEHLRSQGPFRHAILAGTVGAVCAPLMLAIWRKHPLVAKVGLATCLLMIVTSASSGPVMSLILGVFALAAWRWRHLTRRMRITAALSYILLYLLMTSPPYYLIARIDLVGGSTGWHRARLIQSAFEHLDEWWWAGTDYTRHWMPTGVSWSPDHTDITNHYLFLGVIGGVPLMVFFIMILWWGFRYVGETMRLREDASFQVRFLSWVLGASLFSHALTCISVYYFDQSILFLYLTLAMIVSLRAAARQEALTMTNGCPIAADTQKTKGRPPTFVRGTGSTGVKTSNLRKSERDLQLDRIGTMGAHRAFFLNTNAKHSFVPNATKMTRMELSDSFSQLLCCSNLSFAYKGLHLKSTAAANP